MAQRPLREISQAHRHGEGPSTGLQPLQTIRLLCMALCLASPRAQAQEQEQEQQKDVAVNVGTSIYMASVDVELLLPQDSDWETWSAFAGLGVRWPAGGPGVRGLGGRVGARRYFGVRPEDASPASHRIFLGGALQPVTSVSCPGGGYAAGGTCEYRLFYGPAAMAGYRYRKSQLQIHVGAGAGYCFDEGSIKPQIEVDVGYVFALKNHPTNQEMEPSDYPYDEDW